MPVIVNCTWSPTPKRFDGPPVANSRLMSYNPSPSALKSSTRNEIEGSENVPVLVGAEKIKSVGSSAGSRSKSHSVTNSEPISPGVLNVTSTDPLPPPSSNVARSQGG